LAQIEAAVRDSASWSEVAGRLGLSPGSGEAISRVSSYAARLGLDHRHFSSYKTAGAIGRRPARDGVNVPYNPAEVDYFFIIDGDENFYIVPLADIGGRISVTVSVINCRKVNGRSLA
jgi:hypothetical protein